MVDEPNDVLAAESLQRCELVIGFLELLAALAVEFLESKVRSGATRKVDLSKSALRKKLSNRYRTFAQPHRLSAGSVSHLRQGLDRAGGEGEETLGGAARQLGRQLTRLETRLAQCGHSVLLRRSAAHASLRRLSLERFISMGAWRRTASLS